LVPLVVKLLQMTLQSPPEPSSESRAQSATKPWPQETAHSAHAKTAPAPQTGNHPPARHPRPPLAPALPSRPVSCLPSAPQAPAAGKTAQTPACAATVEIPPAHFSSGVEPSSEIPDPETLPWSRPNRNRASDIPRAGTPAPRSARHPHFPESAA